MTIGYENDNEIGIKLYQTPLFKSNNKKPTGELTNIYTLVDLCISTNSINSQANFSKEFDPAIPEIIIDSNSFIKILNRIYSCYIKNDNINTKIFYRVGEHMVFDGKKYSLFSIEVSAKDKDTTKINELQALVDANNINVDIHNKITINLPMITE
jgi:tetrahydromethanopterin S-methyltransferase subunit G